MSIRITENAFYSLEVGEREALRYRVGGGDGQEILFLTGKNCMSRMEAICYEDGLSEYDSLCL